MPCAIPPLNMTTARVGRGRGVGFNRVCGTASAARRAELRCVADQLHAGMDLIASRGSPVVIPVGGTVALKSLDSRASPGMGGYGNAIVIRVDTPVAGLPTPFWYSLNHLNAPSPLEVGQRVEPGAIAGVVGSTTNNQFRGMASHLHMELRVRPFGAGGSYDRDTVDPAILWAGVGIDWVGHNLVGGRQSGGQLLVRAGGPADCRAGGVRGLERAFGLASLATVYGPTSGGQAGPGEQYIPPAALSPNYPGVTSPGPADVEPPEYATPASPSASPSSGGSSTALAVGATLVIGLAILAKKR